jgi:hypothetical protein
MKYTTFVVFKDHDAATRGLRGLAEAGFDEARTGLLLHEKALLAADLEIEETDTRTGLFAGLVAGASLGALAGALLGGPLGLLGFGALATAGFSAGAGSVYGALAGALSGAAAPHHTLEKLEAELDRGAILATVHADDLEDRDAMEAILLAHGGEVHHRTVFGQG